MFESLRNYSRWRRAVVVALLIAIVYLAGLSWDWLSLWLALFAVFEALGYFANWRKG